MAAEFVWSELPKDAQLTILCNFSINELSQLRSVCKEWHNIIHRRDFRSLYDKRNLSPPQIAICYNEWSLPVRLGWSIFDTKWAKLEAFPFHLNQTGTELHIRNQSVHSVGSLMCLLQWAFPLHSECGNSPSSPPCGVCSWTVWHPFSNRRKSLPPLKMKVGGMACEPFFVHAFVADEKRRTYKILVAYAPDQVHDEDNHLIVQGTDVHEVRDEHAFVPDEDDEENYLEFTSMSCCQKGDLLISDEDQDEDLDDWDNTLDGQEDNLDDRKSDNQDDQEDDQDDQDLGEKDDVVQEDDQVENLDDQAEEDVQDDVDHDDEQGGDVVHEDVYQRLVTEIYDSGTGIWTDGASYTSKFTHPNRNFSYRTRFKPGELLRRGVLCNGVVYFTSSSVLLFYDIQSDVLDEVRYDSIWPVFEWDGRLMSIITRGEEYEEMHSFFCEWDARTRTWVEDAGREIPQAMLDPFAGFGGMYVVDVVASGDRLVMNAFFRFEMPTAVHGREENSWSLVYPHESPIFERYENAPTQIQGLIQFTPGLDWSP